MPHLSYLTVKRNKETLPIFESPEARAISGRQTAQKPILIASIFGGVSEKKSNTGFSETQINLMRRLPLATS